MQGPRVTPNLDVSPIKRPAWGAPAASTGVARVRAAAGTAGSSFHVVAHGDTLSKISRRYRSSISSIAKANGIEPHARLKPGDRLIIPPSRTNASPREVPAAGTKTASLQKPQVASAGPDQTASVVSPAVEKSAPTAAAKPAAEVIPSFRWPVKARIITGFGPKTNGQQNDGINLAVPEGTPIKAAEDGVVAYAGNELKGYGNLVLLRHPNGYVTAYAHAKELMVKRGDEVKRGQMIAKSGQTGNVDAPQLHFEVRKGPAPIDPVPLLSGG